MFIGEYTHKIDEKGRLALPSKFRPELAAGAVVTRGLDSSLYLYTREEWPEIAEKLAALPFSNPAARAIQRMMLAGATDVVPDRQGRVIIPGHLRAYAGLGSGTQDAVVAGLYKRIEIWSAASWATAQAKTEKETDQVAEHLQSLGI